MNIVLIGLRGAGKTTIAKMLSVKLAMNYISTDDKVIEKAKAPISNIVKNCGWKYFRTIEKNVITNMGNIDNSVIDTGGGAILDLDNVKKLKSLGKVIWLTAPVRLLYKRIGDDIQRPRLTSEKDGYLELQKLYRQRKHHYRNAADIIINTSKKLPEDIVSEITP